MLRRDDKARLQRGGGAHRCLLCTGEHGLFHQVTPACLPWISSSIRVSGLPRALISDPVLQGYIRFSYANSEKNIVEGISRVATYLKSL